jgi:hypothetical protein
MAINRKIAAIAGGFVLAGGLVAIAPGHSTRVSVRDLGMNLAGAG